MTDRNKVTVGEMPRKFNCLGGSLNPSAEPRQVPNAPFRPTWGGQRGRYSSSGGLKAGLAQRKGSKRGKSLASGDGGPGSRPWPLPTHALIRARTPGSGWASGSPDVARSSLQIGTPAESSYLAGRPLAGAIRGGSAGSPMCTSIARASDWSGETPRSGGQGAAPSDTVRASIRRLAVGHRGSPLPWAGMRAPAPRPGAPGR